MAGGIVDEAGRLSDATSSKVQDRPSQLVAAWSQQMKAFNIKPEQVRAEAVTAAFVRGALEVAMMANPGAWPNERVAMVQFLCACSRNAEAMRVIEANIK